MFVKSREKCCPFLLNCFGSIRNLLTFENFALRAGETLPFSQSRYIQQLSCQIFTVQTRRNAARFSRIKNLVISKLTDAVLQTRGQWCVVCLVSSEECIQRSTFNILRVNCEHVQMLSVFLEHVFSTFDFANLTIQTQRQMLPALFGKMFWLQFYKFRVADSGQRCPCVSVECFQHQILQIWRYLQTARSASRFLWLLKLIS